MWVISSRKYVVRIVYFRIPLDLSQFRKMLPESKVWLSSYSVQFSVNKCDNRKRTDLVPNDSPCVNWRQNAMSGCE